MRSATGSERRTAWAGWVQFAAVVILVSGIFSAIQGLMAVIGPDTYFLVGGSELFLFNAAGWGWTNLAIGTLLILTAVALFAEARWARIVAIVLAVISAVVQMFLVPAQPWWSLIVIALDMTVIYALVARGAELRAEA